MVRPRRIAIYAAISASAVVIAMVVVGILLHNTNDGVSFETSDQIGLIGLGVLIGVAILMMARPSLKVFAEGMLVRNILGENFYPWALIYSVSFPQGAQWALLRMPDDETHPADGHPAARPRTSGRLAGESPAAPREVRAAAAEIDRPRRAGHAAAGRAGEQPSARPAGDHRSGEGGEG